jgi:hypothetical protein
MSVVELMRQATALLDAGVLTKHDEAFVSLAVRTHDRGIPLDAQSVSRLREIIEKNS